MGSDADLVKIREEASTKKSYEYDGKGKVIPLKKVAAIAAGFVYNDDITEFRLYCKYMKIIGT